MYVLFSQIWRSCTTSPRKPLSADDPDATRDPEVDVIRIGRRREHVVARLHAMGRDLDLDIRIAQPVHVDRELRGDLGCAR